MLGSIEDEEEQEQEQEQEQGGEEGEGEGGEATTEIIPALLVVSRCC